jgi:hypothetical protein
LKGRGLQRAVFVRSTPYGAPEGAPFQSRIVENGVANCESNVTLIQKIHFWNLRAGWGAMLTT